MKENYCFVKVVVGKFKPEYREALKRELWRLREKSVAGKNASVLI